VICGSIARSFGRKSRVGQLSMMAARWPLPSMSDSDWVAKMTLAFFLRSVFSHSRSWPAKPFVVQRQPAFVDDERVGDPSSRSFDAVEQIGEHGRAPRPVPISPSVSNA
jgi:hypothetical protein